MERTSRPSRLNIAVTPKVKMAATMMFNERGHAAGYEKMIKTYVEKRIVQQREMVDRFQAEYDQADNLTDEKEARLKMAIMDNLTEVKRYEIILKELLDDIDYGTETVMTYADEK